MTAYGLLKLGMIVLLGAGILLGAGAVWSRALRRLFVVWAAAVSAVGWVFVQSHYIEPNWIQIERVKISDDRLHKALKGVRIVHITDIHLNDGLGSREQAMIEKVNALEPDIIFFTGDIIDDLTQVKPAFELLQRLEAGIGIYAVPGNTDHIVMDSGSFKRVFSPAGINVLVNETRRLGLPNGHALWIVGVDDPKYGHDKLQEALKGVPRNEPAIMLAHNPDIFQEAAEAGIPVILAGDTHGGQVGIDALIRLSDYANRTPYMRGLFKMNGTQMYVNRGIGMKTLPIRFLCRPEIAVIEFVDGKET